MRAMTQVCMGFDRAQSGVSQKQLPGEVIPMLGLEIFIGVGQASRSWQLNRTDRFFSFSFLF